MACKTIDNEPDKIMFLYRFIEGECPKSFGMNVARMAGLPPKVIAKAKYKSEEFFIEMQ